MLIKAGAFIRESTVTKNSVREVTNFAKGLIKLSPFAKCVTSLCFTGEERK